MIETQTFSKDGFIASIKNQFDDLIADYETACDNYKTERKSWEDQLTQANREKKQMQELINELEVKCANNENNQDLLNNKEIELANCQKMVEGQLDFINKVTELQMAESDNYVAKVNKEEITFLRDQNDILRQEEARMKNQIRVQSKTAEDCYIKNVKCNQKIHEMDAINVEYRRQNKIMESTVQKYSSAIEELQKSKIVIYKLFLSLYDNVPDRSFEDIEGYKNLTKEDLINMILSLQAENQLLKKRQNSEQSAKNNESVKDFHKEANSFEKDIRIIVNDQEPEDDFSARAYMCEIESLKTELTRSQENVEDCERDILYFTQQVTDLQNEKYELEARLADFEDFEVLMEENKNLKSNLNGKSQLNENLRAEILSNRQSISQLESKLKTIKSEKEEVLQNFNDLEVKYLFCLKEMEQSQNSTSELEKQNRILEAERKMLLEQSNSSKGRDDEYTYSLESGISEWKQEFERMNNLLHDSMSKNEDLLSKIQQLSDQLKSAELYSNKLKEDNEVFRKRLEEAKSLNKQLARENELTKENNLNNDAKIHELETIIHELSRIQKENLYQSQETDMGNVYHDYSSMIMSSIPEVEEEYYNENEVNKENPKDMEVLERIKAENLELKEQLSDSELRSKNLLEDLNSKLDEYDELLDVLNKQGIKLNEVEETNKSLNTKVEELQNQLVDSFSMICSLKDENESSARQNLDNSKVSGVCPYSDKDVKIIISEDADTSNNLINENMELRDQLNTYSMKVEELMMDLNSNENNYNELKSSLNDQIVELNAKINEKDQINKSLNYEIYRLQGMLDDYENKANTTGEENKAQSEVSKVHQIVEEDETDSSEEEIEKLREQLDSSSQKIKDLMAEMNSLENDYIELSDNLNKEIDELNVNITEKDKANQLLFDELNEQKDQLEKYEALISTLMEKNKSFSEVERKMDQDSKQSDVCLHKEKDIKIIFSDFESTSFNVTEENGELRNQLSSLLTTVENLKSNLNTRETDYNELSESLNCRIDELNVNIAEREKTNLLLFDENNRQKDQLEKYEDLISNLMEKNKSFTEMERNLNQESEQSDVYREKDVKIIFSDEDGTSNENAELRNQLNSLLVTVEDLRGNLNTRETDYNELSDALNEKILELNENIAEKEKVNKLLFDEINEQKDMLNDYETMIKTLTDENKSFSEMKRKTEQESEQSDVSLNREKDVKIIFSDEDSTYFTLNKENAELRNQLNSLLVTVEDLRGNLNTRETDFVELSEVLNGRINELNENITEKEKINKLLSDEINYQKDQLQEYEAMIDTLTEEKKSSEIERKTDQQPEQSDACLNREKDVKIIFSDNDGTSNENTELRNQLNFLLVTVEDLKEDLNTRETDYNELSESLNGKITELNEIIKQNEETIASLNDKIKELQLQLENLNEKSTREQNLKSMAVNVGSTQEQNLKSGPILEYENIETFVQKDIKIIIPDVEESNDNFKEIQKELEEIISKLSYDLECKESEIKDLQEKLELTTKDAQELSILKNIEFSNKMENEAMREEISYLENTIRLNKEEISELRCQFGETVKELNDLRDRNEQMKTDYANYETLLLEKGNENILLITDFNKISANYDEVCQNFQKSKLLLDDKDYQIDKFNNEIEYYKDKLRECDVIIDLTKSQLREANAELEEQKQANKNSQNDQAITLEHTLSSSREEYEAELERRMDFITELTLQRTSLDNSNKLQADQIDTLKKELSEKEEELNNMQNDFDTLCGDFNDVKVSLEVVNAKLKEREDEICDQEKEFMNVAKMEKDFQESQLRLKKEVEVLTSQSEAKAWDIKKFKSVVRDLEGRLEKLIKSKENETESRNLETEGLLSIHKEMEETLKKTVFKLKQELESKDKLLRMINNNSEIFEQRLASVLQSNSSLKSELSEATGELNVQTDDINTLYAEYEAVERENQILESSRNFLESELANIRKRIETRMSNKSPILKDIEIILEARPPLEKRVTFSEDETRLEAARPYLEEDAELATNWTFTKSSYQPLWLKDKNGMFVKYLNLISNLESENRNLVKQIADDDEKVNSYLANLADLHKEMSNLKASLRVKEEEIGSIRKKSTNVAEMEQILNEYRRLKNDYETCFNENQANKQNFMNAIKKYDSKCANLEGEIIQLRKQLFREQKYQISVPMSIPPKESTMPISERILLQSNLFLSGKKSDEFSRLSSFDSSVRSPQRGLNVRSKDSQSNLSNVPKFEESSTLKSTWSPVKEKDVEIKFCDDKDLIPEPSFHSTLTSMEDPNDVSTLKSTDGDKKLKYLQSPVEDLTTESSFSRLTSRESEAEPRETYPVTSQPQTESFIPEREIEIVNNLRNELLNLNQEHIEDYENYVNKLLIEPPNEYTESSIHSQSWENIMDEVEKTNDSSTESSCSSTNVTKSTNF